MTRPKPNALVWLVLSAIIIALDLWTKGIALDHLVLHEPVPVIDGWLNWTLTRNYGAAFSFLNNGEGWQRWLFTALAAAVSTVLAVWLSRIARNDWKQALPFALIVGGALGNMIDRVRFGYVVDFIDAYWGESHWPAFNIADSAIVGGAIGLALFTILMPPKPEKAG
jgi:signal peptidase II